MRPLFVVLLLGVLGALGVPRAALARSRLPEVAPVDFSRVKLEDFADDELNLPFYYAHLHELANAIDDRGPTRGYIRLFVWRRNQGPWNARVMENILALSWFYATKRPWNQYYGNRALRARLEAALDFWCRSQAPDGRFSEYSRKGWALPPTAFATKFIGEALLVLRDGPPIDEALYARAIAALRRAVLVVLTSVNLYEGGRTYTNQFGNVWGGGLVLLELRPEPALRRFLFARLRGSRDDFLSPAGFYYESGGPDFGYTLYTHGPSTAQAYRYAKGGAFEQELVERERAFFDWLAFNVAPEPGGKGFFLNRAVETRQEQAGFESYETPLAEQIPFAAALSESREENAVRVAHERGALRASFPHISPLRVGLRSVYSPYVFLNQRLPSWLPLTADRDRARATLPAVAPGSRTQQRRDSRTDATFTFVRRPGYYAAFDSGKKATAQQRFGLGLFFSPAYGTLLQNQTDSKERAFGTRAADAKATYESGDLDVTFTERNKPIDPPDPGIHELGNGTLVARYELGTAGEKSLTFGRRGIDVQVKHEGAFEEVLPVLVPEGQRPEVDERRARFDEKGASCEIRFDEGEPARVAETDLVANGKRLFVLTLERKGALRYSLACSNRPAAKRR